MIISALLLFTLSPAFQLDPERQRIHEFPVRYPAHSAGKVPGGDVGQKKKGPRKIPYHFINQNLNRLWNESTSMYVESLFACFVCYLSTSNLVPDDNAKLWKLEIITA
ncbi:hypothetical protein DLD77_03810 [Chitinophaga alhagiae]|uniref:Uncharacterized protein n=1 Tax=Chitinophaga alhagiae TaxID=2203219 RepID=A0ABN5LT68_9BACT|nr:hypothetical protein DLD77_03810 [Chitinophaga alhagiae]